MRVFSTLEGFLIRLAQVVFETCRASIQFQVYRGGKTDSYTCSTKAFGIDLIWFTTENERGDLFKRPEDTASGNYTHIQLSIIKIGVRRHLHRKTNTTRIAYEHLK